MWSNDIKGVNIVMAKKVNNGYDFQHLSSKKNQKIIHQATIPKSQHY